VVWTLQRGSASANSGEGYERASRCELQEVAREREHRGISFGVAVQGHLEHGRDSTCSLGFARWRLAQIQHFKYKEINHLKRIRLRACFLALPPKKSPSKTLNKPRRVRAALMSLVVVFDGNPMESFTRRVTVI
jgi:hypothetical protein